MTVKNLVKWEYEIEALGENRKFSDLHRGGNWKISGFRLAPKLKGVDQANYTLRSRMTFV
jgi:hypothetical protein